MTSRYSKQLNPLQKLGAEEWLELMLAMFLLQDIITKVFAYIFYRLGNKELGIYVYIFLLYGLTFASLLRFHVPVKRWASFVLIWSIAAAGFLLCYMTHPQNAEFFTRANYGALERVFRPNNAIYAYFFFRLCRRSENVLTVMRLTACILAMYYTFLLLDARSAGGWMETDADGQMRLMNYSLVYGYQALFPAAVFANAFFGGKKIAFFGVALSFTQIILGGSRGPMLLFVTYCGLLLIKNWSRMSKIKYAVVLLLAAVGFFLSDSALELLEQIGGESRTIRMLLEGSIADDNGRDAIQNTAKELIRTGGPFGWGIYGDRPALSHHHFAGYPHNLFLEILTNYGWFLGGAMCVIMVIDIARMVLFCKNRNWWDVYTSLMICAAQLMVSQSYWYVWAFWGAWAVSANYRDERRYLKRNSY